MNSRSIASTILLATIVFLSANSCQAQSIPSTIGGIELTTSTENPTPGQEITITAKNYTLDINAATITWTVGGKVLARGLGIKSVTMNAPTLGKAVDVVVRAVMPDGTTFTNSVTINSTSVDMVIETKGYAPPMFMGKSPVSHQNQVEIVAVPHLANSRGVEYEPQNLIYKWEQGSSVLEDKSGYGRQSITVQAGIIPRPFLISVTVTTRDGLAQGKGQVMVTPRPPFAIFYKNDPLYGSMYNLAVGNTIYLGSQREVGVIISPFGFNAPASGIGNMVFKWFINGAEHPELASNKSVTLRAANNTAGTSNVQLNITHSKDILQQAQAGFSAVFNAPTDNNFSTGI